MLVMSGMMLPSSPSSLLVPHHLVLMTLSCAVSSGVHAATPGNLGNSAVLVPTAPGKSYHLLLTDQH